ncbi:MAG: hypothetical protein ACYC1C_06850 [Chloroflexota bacterium]
MSRTSWLLRLTGGAVIATVAAGAAVAGTYMLALRPIATKWGATDDEIERPLPGDDMVPNPKVTLNHAVTIYAPRDKVWPWLTQLGTGRGGWYSYDFIDNAGTPSADRILSEYQDLKPGDAIPMTTDGKIAMPVVEVEPNRLLVLGGWMNPETGEEADPSVAQTGEYFAGSWTFVLDELGSNATRLLVRARLDWSPRRRNMFFYGLEPGAFVMDRKMLLGIKERAEKMAA